MYDKVTKTFFEDATGLNSFNIIDREEYPDLSPFNIGSFYVQYYKNGSMFASQQIYYRNDEISNDVNNPINEEFDLIGKINVEGFRPAYYNQGEITNLYELGPLTFESLNGFVFRVEYAEQATEITVNYYRDSIDENNLISSDTISLKESDFLQAPTFGDIIRLNKYVPQGYQTDFTPPPMRAVSLQRILENAPYNIVYTPSPVEEDSATFTVQYVWKTYEGRNQYIPLASETVTVRAGLLRDGEYIENFIDFDAHRPQHYYGEGQARGWYYRSERADSIAAIDGKTYQVAYAPVAQDIIINYYTDDVDPANLIASQTWQIYVDEFDTTEQFYIVDRLPNGYINQYRPMNTDHGVLQNASTLYTFDGLIALGSLSIVYDTITIEHDPLDPARVPKVLYFTDSDAGENQRDVYSTSTTGGSDAYRYTMLNGGYIPYIDLGYTPNEIGDLSVELTGVFQTSGFMTNTTVHGFQLQDYAYGFGYYGPITNAKFGGLDSMSDSIKADGTPLLYEQYKPSESFTSTGEFAIRGYIPTATAGVYTDYGLTGFDGEDWYNTNNTEGTISMVNAPIVQHQGMRGVYRKGASEDEDINYNLYLANKDYVFSKTLKKKNSYLEDAVFSPDAPSGYADEDYPERVNPMTIRLDAYNHYASIYDFGTDNDYTETIFDESDDNLTPENVCRPRGSITLFRTRHPDTGKMNIMPFHTVTYPSLGTNQ